MLNDDFAVLTDALVEGQSSQDILYPGRIWGQQQPII
jgi:hypothetical protein